jgi:ATP-dependent DNA helicase DinG
LKRKYGSVAEAKKEEGEKYAELENSKNKYTAILSMSDNWCWECDERGVSFDVIWPGRYSHLLWSGVSRVVLLSATLWPYTLHLLGLSRDQYEFREFSNGWPPNKGLVYYLPTAKLNYRSTDEDYARVVERMDDIIDARRDRKGIIHTVSYSRMRRLLSHSRNGRIMHTNDSSSDSFHVAERYRKAQAPAVLLSPSYGTGWDFPYEQCEYQIIPKIPFTYAESRVMQERCKDENYRTYMAMMELTQMIGRGRRAHDDRCETFILDSNLPLLMHRGRSFCAKGFAIHKIISLPAKPQKIIPKKPCAPSISTDSFVPVTATG